LEEANLAHPTNLGHHGEGTIEDNTQVFNLIGWRDDGVTEGKRNRRYLGRSERRGCVEKKILTLIRLHFIPCEPVGRG
jgi:hypothetical protein